MTTNVLVIGYGNELRGDDGVGPRVARAIADRRWPGVSALDTHQLKPELAESLASSRQAIFVDAALAKRDRVTVEALAPCNGEMPLGHVGDPRQLLALTRRLYGRCPEAWLVTIAVDDIGFGEGLSLGAEDGLAVALRVVAVLAGVPDHV